MFFEPAAPTPIPQVTELSIPAGRLEPYRPEEDDMQVIDVQVPLETAVGWLEQRQVGEIHETALVRVPFWKCRYTFEGKTFHAAVDASTGQVLASVYPEKAESPFVLVAVLGLILFGIEGLVIGNLFAKFVAYAITAIPLTCWPTGWHEKYDCGAPGVERSGSDLSELRWGFGCRRRVASCRLSILRNPSSGGQRSRHPPMVGSSEVGRVKGERGRSALVVHRLESRPAAAP